MYIVYRVSLVCCAHDLDIFNCEGHSTFLDKCKQIKSNLANIRIIKKKI